MSSNPFIMKKKYSRSKNTPAVIIIKTHSILIFMSNEEGL